MCSVHNLNFKTNMNSIFDKNKFVNNNKIGILECDNKQVLRHLSFAEIYQISEAVEIQLKLFKNYVGILMDHNVYLLPVIMSLYRMKCPFIFLKKHQLHSLLHFNYLLSLEELHSTKSFNKLKVIKINSINIFLWERKEKLTEYEDTENIFCILQTSGSTGTSKIVKVLTSCIADNAINLSKIFKISDTDTIFWGTPLTFDPNLIEFLMGLEKTATLVIVPYKFRLNPNYLFDALFTISTKIYTGITFLQIVPSVFNRWNPNQIEKILKSKLRILAFGGEQFPQNILTYKKSSHMKLFNLYGITELSCWATVKEVIETYGDQIGIGEPIGDTIVQVRCEDGTIVQKGKGEIFIGSRSRHCLVDKEGSSHVKEEKAIINECESRSNHWDVNEDSNQVKIEFRKTGDEAIINEYGTFYIGRLDNVIKRLGHRVNLEDIERIIEKEINLKSKCVFIPEPKKIACFIQIDNLENSVMKYKTTDKIRVKLLNIIPKEMYPDSLELITKFPLNKHGKICKKTLENLYWSCQDGNQETNSGDFFINTLTRYLGLDVDSIEDWKQYSFFELGGNSITFIQVLNEIQEYFGKDSKEQFVKLLFEESLQTSITIASNIKRVEKKRKIYETEIATRRRKSGLALKISWKYDLQACVDSSPLVFKFRDATFIAVGSFSNIFVILTSSGEEYYKVVLGGHIEASATYVDEHESILIGCFDGKMYCIDVKQKTIKWTCKTEDQVKSQPCVCLKGSAVAFGSYDKNIRCVSILDGAVIWKTFASEAVSCKPVVNEKNVIYFTSISGNSFGCKEDTGEIIWKYNLRSPTFASPTLLGSQILIPTVDGIIHYVTELEEKTAFKCDGNIFSSLTVYQDKLVCCCNNGYLYIVKFCDVTFDLLYKLNLSVPFTTKPTIFKHNENVYILTNSNNGHLYVMDMIDGEVLCEFSLENETFSSSVYCDNNIFIGCRDNNLYCLELSHNIVEDISKP